MSRRNARVTLRWFFVLMTMFGMAVACAPTPHADDGSPVGVRVQVFEDPRVTGSLKHYCLVITHDTMQGASSAVAC